MCLAYQLTCAIDIMYVNPLHQPSVVTVSLLMERGSPDFFKSVNYSYSSTLEELAM